MKRENGFSMVEILVALGIMSLVMAGVYSLMIENEQIYQVQTNIADMQQNARVAMDLMTREIRMAGANPSGRAFQAPSTDQPVEVATSNSIWIKMDRPYDAAENGYDITDKNFDLDTNDANENEYGDGFLTNDGESVNYHINGETLYREMVKGSGPGAAENVDQPISDNITQFNLNYYKADGNSLGAPVPVSSLADIAKVQATIKVRSRDKDLKTKTYKEFTLVSEITIRNR